MALDTGEVFIGTPNLPVVQSRTQYPYKNTQILTEWSNNIEELLNYRYRYRNNHPQIPSTDGWSKPTTPEGAIIYRKLQEKLDDIVSVKDYGAKGDGINDDTYAIRKAAIDVTNTSSPYFQRALYFPSGEYIVNDSIFLPPNSKWIGEGIDSTIIKAPTSSKCVLETCDGELSIDDLDNPTQYGNHIEMNISGTLPSNICIIGITFSHSYSSSYSKDVVRLWRAEDVDFINCKFESTWTCGSTVDFSPYFNTSDSIGVSIDSLSSAIKPKNINFFGCTFSNLTYGTFIIDNVQSINFDHCRFENLYSGISTGGAILPGGMLTSENPIVGVEVTNPGSGYLSSPAVTISGGGSGATASSVLGLLNAEISFNGSGYVFGDLITLSGGSFASPAILRVTSVDGFGGILSVLIEDSGEYTVAPTNPSIVTGGSGSSATFDCNFGVKRIDLLTSGSGYTVFSTTVVVDSSPGITATARIQLTDGPNGVKVSYSSFYNIQNTAISFMAQSSLSKGNSSSFNKFDNVGFGQSNCNDKSLLTAPQIKFDNNTVYNSSIGDIFDRLGIPSVNPLYRRIQYNPADRNLIINSQDPVVFPEGINLGSIVTTRLNETILYKNRSSGTLSGIKFNVTEFNTIFIDYSIVTGTVAPVPHRIGKIMIISDGITATIDDTSSILNGPDNITLNVSITGTDVEITYTNTNLSEDGTMKWSASIWKS